MEVFSDDPHQLRHCLRDVVGLTALSALWSGADTRTICNDLVDVLFRIVDLDFTYLVVHDAFDVLRVRDQRDIDLLPRIQATVAIDCPAETSIAARHGATMKLSSHCLFMQLTNDVLIAGSYRPDFPNAIERLLLRVAINQAATWLERKKATDALAAESAFRKGIEDSMLDGVTAVDLDGRQTYVNRAFAEMVGWRAEDLIGATAPFVYWPPAEVPRIRDALQRAMAEESRTGIELQFRRRNDACFDALVLISPLHAESGIAFGHVFTVSDITDRKWAERSAAFLAETGEILGRSLEDRATLEAISTLVARRLADWCFVDLLENHRAFERMAVAHRNPADATTARRIQRRYECQAPVADRAFVTSVVNDVFLQTMAPDADRSGGLCSLDISSFLSVPMRSRGETFAALRLATTTSPRLGEREVRLAEDLAKRTALAVDNARLYTEAQNASRAKDEFFANISHELRTPMTAILGWVHVAQITGIDEKEMRSALDNISQSARAQSRLIEDLLDISRIITGKLKLEPSMVVLGEVVSSAVAIVRPAASTKRQTIDLQIRAPDATVSGDAGRLQQVFWNLLSNAMKFSPSDEIISVIVEQIDEHNVAAEVKDKGAGISSQMLPWIFERFRQAPGATSLGGLGLGLAIAKDVIELHGGTIRAESGGENQGSTFTVTLPLQRINAESPAPSQSKQQ
jgi:PAS domain S-box-containing protein